MRAYSYLAIAGLLFLTACVSDPVREAERQIAAGDYEQGLGKLMALVAEKSRETEARAALLRARALAVGTLERQAREALEAERIAEATALYQRIAVIDPGNAAAASGIEAVKVRERRAEAVKKAEEAIRSGELALAERRLRDVLLEEPRHRRALVLMAQVAERQRKQNPLGPVLGPEFRKNVSLEFRDVNLKSVFDAIWHASGVNFILDRDVRSDAKASIFVRDVTVEEAIDAVLMTQQLARKLVNSKTVFIYPKTPQKINEYQDLTVRNFFLAHADAKQVQNMLKTILKIRDVFIDEKRNLVVVRDSQEAVEMAEKLVRAHDQPEPEVMLALDVIEIKRSKLSEIGLNLPGKVAVGVGNPITVQAARDLTGAGVSIGIGGLGVTGPGVVGEINLSKTSGDTNMLANPRIRVRNREKAKIHIGDRLPVVTTTSSSTSTFVGQTVNYLDVGLKLEVEPQVMLDDDVVIKLNLEVSSATQSKVNASFYDVGTRNTNTVLTIRDGETQVLAGLIRDDEREAGNRVPGIGDLPVLGRLFANEKREQDKTEIILAITPRVLRNLTRPGADLVEYVSGPELRTGGAAASSAPAPVSPVAPPRPVPAPAVITSPAPPPVMAPGSPSPSAPPTAVPQAPAGGVIPMIEFETPPGVGSNRGR